MLKSFSRIPHFRRSVCKKFPLAIQCNFISISKMNYEKAVEELQSNPYYNKYANKISELQKASPQEFLARLEHKDKKNQKKTIESSTPLAGQPGNAKSGSTVITKPKLLCDVMKTELLVDKSPDEIKSIWLDYHKNKDCIAASVPLPSFDLIHLRSNLFPTFLLPLPRDQGYEFILCQFSGNEVHFTPLVSYQTHKENAPECLTIVYYPDLRQEKGLILMRGEFNKDVITSMEAQCLANQLQLYYGEEDEKRTRLLERFTNYPDDFRHMDLIANLETLSF